MTNKYHMPRKILFVVSRMDRGGAESWLMSLLRHTDRNVMAMDFCVLSGERGVFAPEIRVLGGKIIPCPLKPWVTFKRRFAEILTVNQYDVVHSHLWNFSGVILKIAHGCNIPIRVVHSHNTGSYNPNTLYRKLYNRCSKKLILQNATHCLACGNEAAESLFGTNWKNNKKCQILYCSIDLDPFCPTQRLKIDKGAIGLPPNRVVIGNVGNLRVQKNHTFLLDIASEFLKIRPDALFFIAGEGVLRPALEAKAEKLGICEHINFVGVRTDVPQLLMNVFDAFLFPSLTEGMPVSLIEAAAAGLPTVCSDTITEEATDIIPELFTRLPLNISAKTWAEAIDKVLKKPRIPRETSYNIIKNSHFSVDYSLEKLKRVYGIPKECV